AGRAVARGGAAGVEPGSAQACTGAQVPGLAGADAAGGVEVPPLLAVARVVRGQRVLQELVDLDVFNRRVGGDLAHQHLRLDPVELLAGAHDLGAGTGAAQVLEPDLARAAGAGRG